MSRCDTTARLVSFAFFLSGAAGLIFEIAWLHRCTLLFGSTIWATSLVAASFMGGLALGTAAVVVRGRRIVRFFAAYAALEAVVAVTGILLTLALPRLALFAAFITRHADAHEPLANAARFAIAFAALAVPTTAMGATLPILVAGLSGRGQGFGQSLGRLYGWNTVGALVGVLGAEIVLIFRLGISGSSWFAGALNLCAAAAAWRLAQHAPADRASVPTTERMIRAPRSRRPSRRRLVCAFMAGANLMALELLWFRLLLMFVVNSTLALSLILAVILGAIACGGLIASHWLARQREASGFAPAVALAAGGVAAASYAGFELTHGAWAIEWYRILWFALVVTFGTSLLSGVLFTLLGDAIKSDVAEDVRAGGWLTLANTAGALCGPLVATFVLIPAWGIERGMFTIALSYALVGGLAFKEAAGRPRARVAAIAAGSALAIALAAFPFGLMRGRLLERSVAAYSADGSRIVGVREARDETVVLLRQDWLSTPIYHRLVTNGFSMSGTHMTGMRYMRLFAYWPMLRHNALRNALVLCYGVGVTAGAVTDIEPLRSIDVVEISPDIVAMSDLIYSSDTHPLNDPRVQVHLDDARQFLQTTDKRYDLITGEPPPPLAPGAVNLYTRDYFELVRAKLADGGIATYWLPIAGDGAYDVTPIIRGFCDVFDDCSLWNGTLFDWMLVGTRGARGPADDAAFSASWAKPRLAERLREVGFEVPEQIGAAFLGDAGYLHQLTANAPPLTDNYPQRLLPPVSKRLLLAGPAGPDPEFMRVFRDVIDTGRAKAAFERSPVIRRLWPATLAQRTLPYFDAQRIINRVMWEGANPLRYVEELHRLLTDGRLERLPLWSMGSNDALQRAAIRGDPRLDPSGMIEYERGLGSLATRNYDAAVSNLAEADRRGLDAPALRPLLAYALWRAGNVDAATRLARAAVIRTPDERHFWSWLLSQFDAPPAGAGAR